MPQNYKENHTEFHFQKLSEVVFPLLVLNLHPELFHLSQLGVNQSKYVNIS